MIPKTITRQHILDAIAAIDRDGVPRHRESHKFHVPEKGRSYPPKYLVALAHRIATGGTELPSSAFNGGLETNRFLKSRGFKISGGVKASPRPTAAARSPKPKKTRPRPKASPRAPAPARRSTARSPVSAPPVASTSDLGGSSHSGERCKQCKSTIEKLLRRNYGDVQRNHRLEGGARPEDYAGASCYKALSDIFAALQRHRGHNDFVRAQALPPSDFFVPHPGFLLEFDESQHFTELRRVALDHYPADLLFGFDLREWSIQCGKLHKTDNDPPYRDEQRAWYDTLRDFAPHALGLLPTLRLDARGFRKTPNEEEWTEWCSLDPANPMHVETFRQILGERADFWRIDFFIPSNAPLARIVIDGSWRGDSRLAKKLLRDVCDRWPSDARVHCLSTCGAFIVFDWPDEIPSQADNLSPGAEAMQKLDDIARGHLKAVLGNELLQRLRKVSDFLTVGVDSRKSKISSTDNWLSENHAELVYIVDLKTGKIIGATGKSYPTLKQQRGLFRVKELGSHFVSLGGVSAMVLGCHDLTIFNPRSDAKAKGWRMQVKSQLKRLTKKLRPEWVLHHPHTTVSPMTWRHAWSALSNNEEYPSIKSYLGTGCYSYCDKNWKARKSLQAALDKTKSRDVADIVVHPGMPEARPKK